MNLCALAAAVLLLLALLAHFFVGTSEYRSFAPEHTARDRWQAWVQGLAAWHFVSVDLLATTVLLFLFGLGDWIPAERTILQLLATYFVIQGIAWLLVLAVSGKAIHYRYLKLPQWILFWVVAGLAFAAT